MKRIRGRVLVLHLLVMILAVALLATCFAYATSNRTAANHQPAATTHNSTARVETMTTGPPAQVNAVNPVEDEQSTTNTATTAGCGQDNANEQTPNTNSEGAYAQTSQAKTANGTDNRYDNNSSWNDTGLQA